MNPRARLRELLKNEEFIQAPGAYDCLTAKLIEHAGFSVVYMSGYATSAARLGLDWLSLTMNSTG